MDLRSAQFKLGFGRNVVERCRIVRHSYDNFFMEHA